MDWNQLEGNWKQVKGKIREKWGDLTDDDVAKLQGNREQFEGKLQERYGKSKDAIRKDVDDWLKTLH
ncbi:MAG: CsbD family protein [Methylocystaceae bacterium]|nr:MAG: CsbD family protein [Methylocystaceae bacterium]